MKPFAAWSVSLFLRELEEFGVLSSRLVPPTPPPNPIVEVEISVDNSTDTTAASVPASSVTSNDQGKHRTTDAALQSEQYEMEVKRYQQRLAAIRSARKKAQEWDEILQRSVHSTSSGKRSDLRAAKSLLEESLLETGVAGDEHAGRIVEDLLTGEDLFPEDEDWVAVWWRYTCVGGMALWFVLFIGSTIQSYRGHRKRS